jgi:hypothetical protein
MVVETADAKQLQIQRILESKPFRTSEIHRNLLQYLSDKALSGEGDSVKEYTLGLDVFGKPDTFDPRQESSVRMHVARLRQKLTEYYRTEGLSDTLIVDLPKGGFRLVFEQSPAIETEPDVAVGPPAPEGRFQRYSPAWLGAALLAILAVAGATYWFWPSNTQGVAGGQVTAGETLSRELAELWAPFFDSPRPLLVCLGVGTDPVMNAGTANGAFFLGQFLTPDRKREVVLTRSDQISMPEIAMDNVVFVGNSAGTRQIESIPMDRKFVLDAKGVRNLKPEAGEPAYLADRMQEGDEGTGEETYALITQAPGLYGSGRILLLEGNHTSSVMAAVRSLTDPSLARTVLTSFGRGGKLPKYYQTVLRVRSMDQMPVEVTPVLHRELPGR